MARRPAAAAGLDAAAGVGATAGLDAAAGVGATAGSRGSARAAQQRGAAIPELQRIRRQIDALDRRIVALLNQRAALGLAAGQAKRVAGQRAIHDPERERAVLARIAAENPGPLSNDQVLAIYRRIMAATRRLETDARRPAKPDQP